jgi:AraC family transcriptional regulator of adaptative response / DNA-3-methyladenine glycosylase II
MHLYVAHPYDFSGLFSWLGARAIAGVEAVSDNAWCRGEVRVRRDGDALLLSHPQYEPEARRLFDVDADPSAIHAALDRDALLAPLLRARPGVRVPGAWDPFELVVRAIVGQQVSVAAARTILGRIAASHGFHPSTLADVLLEGMPRRRAETVRTLARAVAAGTLVLERQATLDESINMLTALPGIGPWTAHYIAMRALGERDAFPAGDLILRRRAGDLTEKELLRRAEGWRPFRAYAAMLLWMS